MSDDKSFFGASIALFFKGLLMGFSDIIPGVSGATIALILGIYERLISAIKKFNIGFLFYYPKFLSTKKEEYLNQSKESWENIEFSFFIPLGIGIGLALLGGSYFIPYLLNDYPVYTFAFFAGLILASINLIKKRKLETISLESLFFIIIGIAIAVYIVGLDALRLNHNSIIVFFSGFLAICAMLLPGISGSFVLLILGQYSFILEALHNLKTDYLIVGTFILGALTGLFGFARAISILLKKYYSQTIATLLGLMVGSLRLPLREILYVNRLHPELGFTFGLIEIFITIIMAIVGISFIALIERRNVV